MALQIEINRLEPQPDEYRKESSEPHFKRTRGWGIAQFDDGVQVNFEIILDIRARLLYVKEEKTLNVGKSIQIGEGIVNEMAVFVATPLEHLLLPVDESDRAEWSVTDADHVNGLLHRIRERKKFTARTTPPVPRRLREITEHLLSVAIRNLEQVNQTWDPSQNFSGRHVPALDIGSWEVNRSRLTDWTSDRGTREGFGRLFELFRTYAQVWSLASQSLVTTRTLGVPDYTHLSVDRATFILSGPAVGQLRKLREEILRVIAPLVNTLGTAEQQEAYLRALETHGPR